MIALVLEWVKKLTGLGSWAGMATLAVGLLVGVGGIAGWLREDALSDCNARWELEIAKRNASLRDAVSKAEIKLKGVELKLADALRDAEAAKISEAAALEKQRAETPQSADCSKCRVPNERIWLRRDRTGSARSSVSPGS